MAGENQADAKIGSCIVLVTGKVRRVPGFLSLRDREMLHVKSFRIMTRAPAFTFTCLPIVGERLFDA